MRNIAESFISCFFHQLPLSFLHSVLRPQWPAGGVRSGARVQGRRRGVDRQSRGGCQSCCPAALPSAHLCPLHLTGTPSPASPTSYPCSIRFLSAGHECRRCSGCKIPPRSWRRSRPARPAHADTAAYTNLYCTSRAPDTLWGLSAAASFILPLSFLQSVLRAPSPPPPRSHPPVRSHFSRRLRG